jgi:hypothetical protein
MPRPGRLATAAIVVSCLAALQGAPLAGEQAAQPQTQAAQPQTEVFTGTLMIVNGPRTDMGRIKITVEHWTTDEERKTLAEAIRSGNEANRGGNDALVDAMDKLQAGYVQIENNLRWPIRSAASFKTEKGRVVRFATNRPINYQETMRNSRSSDYPIGFIQLLLPPEGKGEGTLLAATQVQFGADGKLEVKSLPTNTGAQKVTNVVSEMLKPKKSKKK